MERLRLKEHRETLKLSQSEVAEMFGLTQQAYSRWEKGLSFPNAQQIIKLCDIFKCTPNELFGIKGVIKVTHADLRGELDE